MSRQELQDAIDAAQGPIDLGPGDHVIEMPPTPVGRRRAYAALELGAKQLRGAGPGVTTLRFIGDAAMQDWYGIQMNGGGLANLTLDTSALTGTSEQTHAVQVIGPAMAPTFEAVEFRHPARGTWKGGDGLRMLGRADAIIFGALVRGCSFVCDRSGIAAHGGVHSPLIEECRFLDVGDQPIDLEGDGDHRDWTILNSLFRLGAHPQGDYSIQLHKIDGALVAGNRMHGRGIYVLNGNNVTIKSNRIVRTTAASGVGVIQVDKASSGVRILGNRLARLASAGPGYVVRSLQRDASAPSDLTIGGNAIVQECSGNVIHATAPDGLLVEDNAIAYSGEANKWYGVLVEGSATTRADRLSVLGNQMWGGLFGCVGADGRGQGVGSITAAENFAVGPRHGLVQSERGVVGPVALGDNEWLE